MTPAPMDFPCELADRVAEVTGPYGPVSVSEALIQRLWARGVFIGVVARLASGRSFRLIRPGRLNRAEGPDFLEAEWELDGRIVRGDVEIHFYAADWRAHGHERDARFAGVRLHAVVFPPRPGEPAAMTCRGDRPEVFTLLPHLPEDLETAGLEDALLRGEARPDSLTESLAALDPEGREALLRRAARVRWTTKLEFARRRVAADGAARALHMMFLETLGLRRNRAPMSELAARHPPEEFARRSPEEFYAEMAGRWRTAAVRPANHPLARIHAYAALNKNRPDWMRVATEVFDGFHEYPETDDTILFRKRVGLPSRRVNLRERALAGVVGGTRFDTLAADALLPWHAANGGRDHFPLWWHWPAGDAPESVTASLASLGFSGRTKPLCNGLVQGFLGLALNAGR